MSIVKVRDGALFVLVIGVVFLSGCFKAITRPDIDPSGSSFAGIKDLLPSDTRIIFVHGMCTHTAIEWIDKEWDASIRKYLSVPTGDKVAIPGYDNDANPIKLYERRYQGADFKLSARFILWSGTTDGAKQKILFDNATDTPQGQFRWKRAKFNEEFKQGLLNDCLSEVVLYVGNAHDTMLAQMKAALCAALDGVATGSSCSFTKPSSDGSTPTNIIIVAESLGSKMMLDAIKALEIDAANNSPQELNAFHQAVAPVYQIFMLANQIPLLDLAVDSRGVATLDVKELNRTDSADGLRVFVNAKRDVSESGAFISKSVNASVLNIVAFTDPNDLLSYRFPNNYFGDPTASHIRVTNAIASNGGTFVGLFENPLSAHTTYKDNTEVLKRIFEGNR